MVVAPKCATCGEADKMEEWGESGEFWWHCHNCNVDDADKVVAVKLPEPLGAPFSGSVIKIERDARYIIKLDETKMAPEQAEWFAKEFTKAAKEMFGDDKRRAIILFGSDVKVYEIGKVEEEDDAEDSSAFSRPDAPWSL